MAVLRSSNYVAGTNGWLIRGDGLAEFNDLTVRSRLDIGGDDASSFHVDNNGNMWLGAGISSYSIAPFRVSNTGALVATNANVSGAITASSGSFTGTITSGVNLTTQFGNNINGAANYSGFKIGNTGWENAWVQRNDGSIYFNAQSRNVAPDGTARGVSRLYIDDNNALISFNNGTFSVDYNGAMVASNANITGTVQSGSGNIAGINFSSGRLYSGTNGNWANSNTGFYLDLNGYFSLKDKFYWNPGTNVLTLNGASGSVGNSFTIGSDCRIGDQLRVNEPQASNVVVAKVRGYRAYNTSDNNNPATGTYSLVLEDKNGVNLMYVNDFGNLWSRVAATSSDQRLKTNIEDSNLGLNYINSLKPRKYNLILEEENGIVKRFDQKTRYGFIAQEVKEITDQFIQNFGGWMLEDELDPNSSQSLSYNDFISPLVKAVQELSAKVDELESRLI